MHADHRNALKNLQLAKTFDECIKQRHRSAALTGNIDGDALDDRMGSEDARWPQETVDVIDRTAHHVVSDYRLAAAFHPVQPTAASTK